MPVAGGHDFRGLKPLWHLVSRLKWIPKFLNAPRPGCHPYGITKIGPEPKELERHRNDKRRRLFEAQDQVDARKDGLIEDIEQRLKQRMEDVALFTIRWCVR